jgi:hypothetical protein
VIYLLTQNTPKSILNQRLLIEIFGNLQVEFGNWQLLINDVLFIAQNIASLNNAQCSSNGSAPFQI